MLRCDSELRSPGPIHRPRQYLVKGPAEHIAWSVRHGTDHHRWLAHADLLITGGRHCDSSLRMLFQSVYRKQPVASVAVRTTYQLSRRHGPEKAFRA